MSATHRVICADDTREFDTLDAAGRHVHQVERPGFCNERHVIETRVGDEWVPLHLARAREILAASNRAVIETPDGPMIKAGGGWSKETSERADQVADMNEDLEAWLAALGPHEDTSLTSDGHGVGTHRWCRCAPAPDAGTWVRFERWTREGRVSHGYACPSCRLVTQTG